MSDFDTNSNTKQHTELYNKISDLSILVAKLPEELANKFDTRYAPKWTERAWVYVISLLGGSVVLAMAGTVLVGKVSAMFV